MCGDKGLGIGEGEGWRVGRGGGRGRSVGGREGRGRGDPRDSSVMSDVWHVMCDVLMCDV